MIDPLTERYLTSMGATATELQFFRTVQLSEQEVAEFYVEAAHQHPEESQAQCLGRARARLLWKRRPVRVVPAKETPPHVKSCEAALVAVEVAGLRKLVLRLGIAALILLGILVLLAIPARAQVDVIRVTDGGTPVTTFGGPFTIECGTNLTCTRAGGTSILTMNAAGGGSGCTTGGTLGQLLYDDGAGGCLSSGLSYSGTTLTAPNGQTITWSGTGTVNAREINGTEFTNMESLGKIPIGQGDGTAVWADPLVQGLTAHDADASSTNPVLVGGYASATMPSAVSTTTDAVRAWFTLEGIQTVNLRTSTGGELFTSGTHGVVNVATMNGATVSMGNGVSGTGVQRVTIASDSTGQITANAGTNLNTSALALNTSVDGVEALLTTIDADTSNLSVVGGGTEAAAIRVTIANNSTGVLSVDDNGGALTVDGTVAATQSGTWNITNVSGTVSLPTGAATSANQSTEITSLQLIDNLPNTQGSTTSGQSGVLGLCAVTTSAPGYTTAQSSPCSLTTSGELRVSGSFTAGIVQVNDAMDAPQNVGYNTGDLSLPTQNVTDGADDGAFTAGTDWVTVIGGIATSDTVDAGDRGALAIDTSRNLKVIAAANSGVDIGDVTINNATIAVTQSGTWDEVGINDSGNSITVDWAGTAPPIGAGVEATALRVTIATDSTGLVSVDDGGGALTVDGTVTANLSATDNAVLDVIASPVATIGSTPLQRVAIFDASDAQITSFGGGTEYTEDAAAAANPVGKATILVRADTPAGVTTANGDNVAQRGTDYGAAYVQVVDSSGNFINTFGGSGGTAEADDADFVAGTTAGTPAMGVYESSPTSVTDGDLGTIGITQTRALRTAVEGTVTVDLGANNDVTVTSGNITVSATNLDVQSGGADLATEATLGGVLTSTNFAAAFGTAGTADTQVMSVQGIASMTPLLVGDGAGAFNVIVDSGTVAVTNGGTFATQVDGAALTALQLIDNIVSGAGVNVTQMNGVNVTMGNGVSGTGVQRVTIASDSTGVVGATLAAETTKVIGTVRTADGAGNLTYVDPCRREAKTYTPFAQTSSAQLITGTASERIYICSISIVTATAQNAALVSGTGTVCATSTGALMGGTTAATGWNFAANGGLTLGNGDSSLAQTDTNADNVCLLQSGSGQLSGVITSVSQ